LEREFAKTERTTLGQIRDIKRPRISLEQRRALDRLAAVHLVRSATTDLNCVIERAVAAANDADINIHYVDVTEEFAGHGIGSADPFIYDIDNTHEAFHPNANGYNAYADAIKTKLPGGWFDKSSV
jgi:hypothetical protein